MVAHPKRRSTPNRHPSSARPLGRRGAPPGPPIRRATSPLSTGETPSPVKRASVAALRAASRRSGVERRDIVREPTGVVATAQLSRDGTIRS
jgi:hypothetical protein